MVKDTPQIKTEFKPYSSGAIKRLSPILNCLKNSSIACSDADAARSSKFSEAVFNVLWKQEAEAVLKILLPLPFYRK